MGKKYEVRCDGKFLGHYHSTSPEGAVRKAFESNAGYYDTVTETCGFTATKGGCNPVYEYAALPKEN